MKKIKRDINQEITDSIIKAMEGSELPTWTCPWRKSNAGMALNVLSGNAYQGINAFHLFITQTMAGYQSAKWGTYKQWNDLDCQVRRGQTASPIVFYRTLSTDDDIGDSDDDDGDQKVRMVRKIYSGFNADQVDGYIDPDDPDDLFAAPNVVENHEETEAYIKSLKVDINVGGDNARFVPNLDIIEIPAQNRFFDTPKHTATNLYYSTILHELIHWSGGKKRLNRFDGVFTDKTAYAKEELIAEIGSMFLSQQLGVTGEISEHHLQYVQHWVEILKEDNTVIFKTAALANKAVQYLNDRADYKPA